MPYTIIIDAGHGGSDPGAVYNGRNEKDDNLALALEVGRILSEDGFNVIYTRTSDVYDSPIQKATIANDSNADFFLSFHRNSTAAPNTSSGIETLVYNDSGIKAQVARSINENLAELGFRDRGVIERPNLVVLRRTRMPAVLIETGFINNDSDNALFDSRFNEIAYAIAAGVADVLSRNSTTTVSAQPAPNPQFSTTEPRYKAEIQPPLELTPDPAPILYKVQVGAFERPENAYSLANRLDNDGFPSYVQQSDNIYRVFVGAFEILTNAVNLEKDLRRAGYQTYITTA